MATEDKPKSGKGSRGPRGPRKDHARELERIREFCAMSVDVLKSFGPQDADKCLAGP